VSRNSSSDAAGIAHSGGGLTVRNSTIASNRATRYMGDAAGISTYGGRRPTLGNTIVALNTFEDDGLSAPERIANCSGPVTSSGHNLENGSTCRFNQPSDVRVAAPRLGPLQDNGGPTPTHALLLGSSAIDSGGSPFPRVDQRGVPRPQGTSSDVGAFERAQR